jgi:tetratricopeptide (TPR) repeat protein
VRSSRISAPIACLVFGLALAAGASAAPFDDGERLYREDKAAAAVTFLEKAVLDPGVDERAYLYLAGCYYKLGRLDEAAATLRKGLGRASAKQADFYIWLGDIYLQQGKNSFAADMLTQAIGADGASSAAYLQRASARMNLKDYKGAREDYSRFLDLEPASPKRPSIEALLAKLGAGIAEAERAAAVAEAKKQAEDEARKELLEKMAASLKEAADETQGLSAGAGDAQSYDHEMKLDE